MSSASLERKRSLVLVGAGCVREPERLAPARPLPHAATPRPRSHAHIQVLRDFALRPLRDGVALTLIDVSEHAWYSGSLPGVVAGLLPVEEAMVPLRPLCCAARARLIRGRVVRLDSAARQLVLVVSWGELRVEYDIASFNVGSVMRPIRQTSGERGAGVRQGRG